MTLRRKDWFDLVDILTCALDEDMVYIDAMIEERKTGIARSLIHPCMKE